MSDTVFTQFETQDHTFLSVKLTEENINEVAEELGVLRLYVDGTPFALFFGIGLQANIGEHLVLKRDDLLITDHETFDFFFNPKN